MWSNTWLCWWKTLKTVHQTTLQPKVIHVNRPSSAENYLKEVEGLKVRKALRTCCKVFLQLWVYFFKCFIQTSLSVTTKNKHNQASYLNLSTGPSMWSSHSSSSSSLSESSSNASLLSVREQLRIALRTCCFSSANEKRRTQSNCIFLCSLCVCCPNIKCLLSSVNYKIYNWRAWSHPIWFKTKVKI